MDKKSTNNVIFLIGPMGTGKTLLSHRLASRNNITVITTDMMRHCPKSMQELYTYKDKVANDIRHVHTLLDNCTNETERTKYLHDIERLRNNEWTVNRQIEMRKLLPNLPNYEEMGYDPRIAQMAHDKLGPIGWHFYQKQFENQLLKALTEQINFDCIVDMGGGMSVSLDDEYSKLIPIICDQIGEEQYNKYLNPEMVGLEHIKQALAPYDNIVELQLPDDYKVNYKRAGEDKLNEAVIASGQYVDVAKHHIKVGGLLVNNQVDWAVADQLCSTIEDLTNLRSHDIADNR